jgi:hypothetical protein
MDEESPPRSEPDDVMRLLQGGQAYILSLPADDRHIATMAAHGAPVWEIAQQMRMSEAAVAHTIDRVIAALTGREVEPVETGGLGADTDPGVSGGYDPEPFG